MAENNKIYITANELAEMLGVSVGHAYKLIRKLNQELEKDRSGRCGRGTGKRRVSGDCR